MSASAVPWHAWARRTKRLLAAVGPGTSRLAGVVCLVASQLSGAVLANDLPELIRIVVPLSAGSSLDSRARMLAEALGRQLQRRVIVENRPGAGGTVGALYVARARPDGATLLFYNTSHVISPHAYRNLAYDALRDFVVVSPAYESGLVLVAHPDVRATTAKELVALARSQREPLSYASSGIGGLPHLAMALFENTTGIDLVHVPYRGDAQGLTDVLPGRIPLMVSGYPAALPHVQAGKLRAIAVTSAKRTSILPDVPTIAESGFPDYSLDVWTCFLAPTRTPSAVLERLRREIRAALATPAMQQQLAASGAQPINLTPEEMTAYMGREWARYALLAQRLDLTPE